MSGRIDTSSGPDMNKVNRIVSIWAWDTGREKLPKRAEMLAAFPIALRWLLSHPDEEILKMPNIGKKVLVWAKQHRKADR